MYFVFIFIVLLIFSSSFGIAPKEAKTLGQIIPPGIWPALARKGMEGQGFLAKPMLAEGVRDSRARGNFGGNFFSCLCGWIISEVGV